MMVFLFKFDWYQHSEIYNEIQENDMPYECNIALQNINHGKE